MQKFIADPKYTTEAKLKVILLYALRYEKTVGNSVNTFVRSLEGGESGERNVALVQQIILYSGAGIRLEDIFLNNDMLARTKNVLKGLKVITI